MTSDANSYPVALHEAQRYLRAGDKASARYWAQQAANLIPDQEDPWLILAAVASPRASIEYLNHALEINPDSVRARKGMHWAIQRYRRSQTNVESQGLPAPLILAPILPGQVIVPPIPPRAMARRQFAWRSVLVGFMIFLFGLTLWFGYTTISPILNNSEPLKVAQFIAKASRTPIPTQADLAQSSVLSTQLPDENMPGGVTPPVIPTATDANLPATATQASINGAVAVAPEVVQGKDPDTQGSSNIPTATPVLSIDALETLPPDTIETPVSIVAGALPGDTTDLPPTVTPEAPATAILEPPTDTPEPTAKPTKAPKKQAKKARQPDGLKGLPSVSAGQHWIDVDLSQQRVYAYEGDQIVNIFVVSTGTAYTPTVTGQYRIYVKYRAADMSGPGYYLPDVPYVMYFYKGYGLHGTYWHHNFGTPMSHGCVNLKTPEAQWLFAWTSVGTLVNVHN